MDTRRSIGREKAGYREGPCDRCRSHSLSRSSRCTARPNLIRRSGCNFGEQTACQAEGSSRLPFSLDKAAPLKRGDAMTRKSSPTPQARPTGAALRRFRPFASSRRRTAGVRPESRRSRMRARRLILCLRCCTHRSAAGSRCARFSHGCGCMRMECTVGASLPRLAAR